ncbi:hypothetical protein SDC9_71091 [bioreactor metagenome]|uniref:Glycosyltransferase RgtA/B/C/D-like domain-containing protein n=1 Tax=bioreactor metagenome TaxID=1076179 RepID=A0A644Y9K9_9ZZZZ
MKNNKLLAKLVLFTIIIIGFLLRLIGLNWDQGQHLHPDERFLTMVSSTISLPKSIGEYFDTDNSNFNPNNNNFNFYVYGTFPLLIVKFFAQIFNLNSYDQIFLVGRVLSAFADTLTILLVFLLTKKIFKNTKSALLSSFLYAICIFSIQQSHFFTVDAITVFLFVLSIYLLISQKTIFSGLFFGIALASKTSIGIVLPFIFLFILFQNKNYLSNFLNCFLFGLFLLVFFRLFQPYAFEGLFKLSPIFIKNIHEAHQMITGEIDYPPNVQWQHTLPFVHSINNLFFVGLGPITFSLVIISIFKFLKNKNKFKNWAAILLMVIIFVIFIYHASLLAQYMRYFYPIFPFLIVFSGAFIKSFNLKILKILVFLNLLITLAFINIYLFPHSRYQASEWICNNISSDKILSSEVWDDSLPINSFSCLSKLYQNQNLPLYDSDSNQKWQIINQQLNKVDYLILSSNRLWGSIPKNFNKYPKTTIFYQNLFDNKTNFKLVKKFYSYPGYYLPFLKKCYLIGSTNYPYKEYKNTFFEIDENCSYPGVYLRDDLAQESFTVYDHPQVIIFSRL